MKKHAADYWILIIVIGLTLFGILMIQSASYYKTMNTLGPYYYAKKQMLNACIGMVALFGAWCLKYTFWKKVSKIAYVLSVVALAAVLLVGTSVNGATRWIYIGSFNFQPSDVAKLALVMILADLFSKDPMRIKKIGYIILAVALGGAMMLLIMLQPNLSTTVCIAGILVAMLFIAGINMWYIGIGGGLGVGAIAYLAGSASYRVARLKAFFDPWSDPLGNGYQLIQSFYALGSGGFFGVGIGASRQKYLYMPFAESDFIFSIIAEEIGLIGCIIFFLAYVILIWRGIRVAVHAPDSFSCLLATGIVATIAIQVIINIAVVTGAVPPTGLPLPFISYGGTSLIIFMASAGILLNISTYTVEDPSFADKLEEKRALRRRRRGLKAAQEGEESPEA
ncbi:MAG: putative lipid II flippase FtsW [Clostridiales bacterium]|nr:putative lipid II flippase FtsW [Clostridiales bacterium]